MTLRPEDVQELAHLNYEDGYKQAILDAVEAVKSLPKWRLLEAPGKYVRRDHAVAAIEALGSER